MMNFFALVLTCFLFFKSKHLTWSLQSSPNAVSTSNPSIVGDSEDFHTGQVSKVSLNQPSSPALTTTTTTSTSIEATNNHIEVKTEEVGESGVPLLPPPKSEDETEIRTLSLGGSIKMDELGPMIVNTDGTLRRIANWATLTKFEQTNTLRIIAARNKKRLEAIKLQQQEEAAASVAESSEGKEEVEKEVPAEDGDLH